MIKLKMNDKMLKILVIAGIAGIALIFISSFLGGTKKEATNAALGMETTAETLTNEEYAQKLEAEVYELLSTIEGVGKTKVMITLSSGVEYVYATEDNLSTDKTSDSEATIAERVQTSKKTILIEDENGRRKALLKKTVEPAIKGAVIVCEGGDDIIIKERVTEAIRVVLGISSTKICVTK